MAVSRGGGFSGGGGRSFSSHGGGGSSGSHRPTFSRRPFLGATTYFYITHTGHRREFYSSVPPKREKKSTAIITAALFLVVLIAFAFLTLSSVYPSKLSAASCEKTGVYLNDGAGIIEDKDAFNLSMAAFYEKTGVEPRLYTLKQADFPTAVYGALDAEALIDFAYDEYYSLFTDEGHYLIVMVKCTDGEYLWCEMAGDDTTGLIDGEAFANMQVNMLKLKSDSDVGALFSEVMTALSEDVFVITDSDRFGVIMISLALLVFLAVIIINLVSSLKRASMLNEYLDYKESHPHVKTFEKNDGGFNNFKNY